MYLLTGGDFFLQKKVSYAEPGRDRAQSNYRTFFTHSASRDCRLIFQTILDKMKMVAAEEPRLDRVTRRIKKLAGYKECVYYRYLVAALAPLWSTLFIPPLLHWSNWTSFIASACLSSAIYAVKLLNISFTKFSLLKILLGNVLMNNQAV